MSVEEKEINQQDEIAEEKTSKHDKKPKKDKNTAELEKLRAD